MLAHVAGVLTAAVSCVALTSSVPFLLSAVAYTRRTAWARNIGFLVSSGYSFYLAVVRTPPLGRKTNVANILLNVAHVIARYYFLHGLLSFRDLRVS